MSDDHDYDWLSSGQQGTVWRIDDDGDALIHFDGSSVRKWVKKEQFWLLGVLLANEARDEACDPCIDTPCGTSTAFKTRICIFHANGNCAKGVHCTFAHGFNQLRGRVPAVRILPTVGQSLRHFR